MDQQNAPIARNHSESSGQIAAAPTKSSNSQTAPQADVASLPTRERTAEEIKMRSDLHKATRDHLIRLQLSNSEGFDRAILTLSSAGLALSITVVKEFVGKGSAHQAWSLQAAWILFAASIATVVISYITSQQGINDHLEYAHAYYEEGCDEYRIKSSPWRHWTIRLGYAGGALFLIAIAALIWFSISNMT